MPSETTRLLDLACREFGLHLTSEQLQAFEDYEEKLYAANQVMNLTRIPREEAWLRHFLDSLLFQDLLPANATVLDIGSGPGFPAWPLACGRPDIAVTALDSSGKMLGFLDSVPLPNLRTINERAEDWRVREKFDVVTGRALAPLTIQLEISALPAKVGAKLIPMRTEGDLRAIEAFDASVLGLELLDVVRRELPVLRAPRVFPIYQKVSPTPREYPRTWAEIKRKPL